MKKSGAYKQHRMQIKRKPNISDSIEDPDLRKDSECKVLETRFSSSKKESKESISKLNKLLNGQDTIIDSTHLAV